MRPVNFAIVGAGNIGKVHLEAIRHIPEARVAVICDSLEGRGRQLAQEHGAEWVAGYEEAVAHPQVEVVSVCTPSGSHMEIAVAAAQAGRHLLVEKPLDITLARVDGIIEAARAAGVKLACIFPQRFRAGVHRVREAIQQGRLGRLTLADAYVKWYRPQEYYASWRGTWGLDGGGALMNQSIHSIDLVQWLAGPVERVAGHTATLAHDMETEDTASAVLAFRNGALGVIQGATSCWPGEPARVELHGDRGTIVLEEGRIVRWQLEDADPEEEERLVNLEAATGSGSADPTAIGFELHQHQIVDLIEAIRTDRPPAIPGEEGRHAVEIIRAVYHSSATGQPVTLPFDDRFTP